MKWWLIAKNHPSVYPVERDLIEQMQPILENILGEDAFYAAIEEIENHDLNEVVEEVARLLI